MDLFQQLEKFARPTVNKKPWMDDHRFELVTNETLDKVIDECIAAGLYALDLETEGLDNRVFDGRTVHQIVGACLSPDGHVGYYIPVRHKVEEDVNVPVTRFEKAMKRLADSDAVAIFHNATFDTEFLQFAGSEMGEWDNPKQWEDSQIEAYLINSRRKQKGLKPLSKNILGYEMIELKELFDIPERKSGNLDFSTLDPTWEPVLWYAGADAICTYLLHKRQIDSILTGNIDPEITGMDLYKPKSHGGNQRGIYMLEKLCVPATRWMQRCRIPIDKEKVSELIQIGHREWFACMEDVYQQCEKVLKRDIRPGHYRLILDEKETEWFFDPDVVIPSYKERLDQASLEASRRQMDKMEVGSNGKTQIATIVKKVSKLAGAGKEDVAFPMVYDVNSQQQLGLLFRELEVEGLQVTEKSGQVNTSAAVLDEILDAQGEKYPFMASIKRFREVQKALSSNLYPLYTDIDPRDHTLRVDFHQFRVDTGRYSTKGRQKGKPLHGGTTYNLHSTPSTYDPRRPECLRRIREVFVARPGRKLVAIDYAGVELRIVTNLSREEHWLNEFFRCSSCGNTFDRGTPGITPPAPPARCPRCGSDKIGDLHTLTGLSIFGNDAKDKPEWKQLRQNAKATNFALCYGGGGSAVQRATSCDKQEGWRIKGQFDKTYKTLARWWSEVRGFAKKHGYVMTGYNRWYPLPDINHEMRGFRAKAERNAVNGPVQGTSADIMKLAMGLIYKECKKRGWLEKARMIITIHDELVFEIDDDILAEAIDVFCHLMTVEAAKRLKWPVPLTVDVEIGQDWTVPWDLNEMRHNEVRFKGDKKIKGPDKLEDPSEWDSLPSWPASLIELFDEEQKKPLGGGARALGGQLDSVKKGPAVTAEQVANLSPGGTRMDIPTLERGAPFVHEVSLRNLSITYATTLAHVIDKCSGNGTHPLRVVLRETGEDIWDGPEVLVDPTQFTVLAFDKGV